MIVSVDPRTPLNVRALRESEQRTFRKWPCAGRQLVIVWGPPGTGKTDTLVAFLHAVIRQKKARKILIAGPNYRTVEELCERLVPNLDKDPAAVCDFYWLYSRSRTPKVVPTTSKHLNYKPAVNDFDDPNCLEMLESVADSKKLTVISSTAHNVHSLTEKIVGTKGDYVHEIFDLVVLDESSQIPVTLALKPLSALTMSGQLIIAGDHMQMPPIQRLEPPDGAEHLVGSIQEYLVRRFAIEPAPLLLNYRSNEDLVEYARSLG